MTTQNKGGPTLDRLHVLSERGSREYVYPADVHGRWTRLKPWVFAALIAIYVALPLIRVGGRPAVFIDIAARHFYLFGRTFNAQDFYLVFFFLTALGFALIVLAALLGRLWCGWACPQTVFLEGVFRRIERWIEGSAAERQKLARAPWTLNKLLRKGGKHALYLLVSFLLAHVLLSYFVSLPGLLRMMSGSPQLHLTEFVWAVAITAILYVNFFWFREQLCLVICPYGRLQSAMQDPDTVVIGYDRKRGEPRGKRDEPGAGDCVDCRRCVAVCPTAIDIRNGAQLECVGCAACIDACDEIMVKLGRPQGLVRYDSERGLAGEPRRWFRPRLFVYLLAGAVGLAVATTVWLRQVPFEANLVHGIAAPFVLDADQVRNHFLVHLVNKGPAPVTLELAPLAEPPLQVIVPQPRVELEALGSLQLPIIISVPRAAYRPGLTVRLRVREPESGSTRELTIPVSGPSRRATSQPVGGGPP